jgi:glucose/arabinose dehydrogenase
MRMRLWALPAVLVLAAACGKGAPAPSGPGPAPGGTITGRERISWDQQAANRAELDDYRFFIYVDSQRNEMAGVTCSHNASNAGFACSGALPAMSNGAHTLQIAAIVQSTSAESPLSAPLQVIVAANTSSADTPVPSGSGDAGTTADGVALRVERLAEGLQGPSDSAFAPDGRLFIAERAGRVRIWADGQLGSAPALELDDVSRQTGLLAIAVDPDFVRTRLVYLVYATTSSSGRAVFRLARFREAEGVLAERAVLLEEPLASADATAALRFGLDGKLYVTFGDGGDSRLGENPSSFNGKLLRLDKDGRTPSDQSTPIFATGLHFPRALAWQAKTGLVWTADSRPQGPGVITALASVVQPRLRSIVRATHRLKDTGVESLAVYAGNLIPEFADNLLAVGYDGTQIVRVRVDPADPRRILGIERLLENAGRLRLVFNGPDGRIYFCTSEALGRLTRQ